MKLVPKVVAGLPDDIIDIVATPEASFALSGGGSVYTWGYIGHDTFDDGAEPLRANFSGISTTKISTSSTHALALSSDGAVFSWGYGVQGVPVRVKTSDQLPAALGILFGV